MSQTTHHAPVAHLFAAPVFHRSASVARMGAARGLLREKADLEVGAQATSIPAPVRAAFRRRASQAGRRAMTMLRDASL